MVISLSGKGSKITRVKTYVYRGVIWGIGDFSKGLDLPDS